MVALPEFRIIYIGILLRLKRKAGDDEEADKEDDASQVKVTDKDLQRQLRRVHLDVNISVAIHVFRCLLFHIFSLTPGLSLMAEVRV